MRLLESKVTGMEINKVLSAFIVSWLVKAEGESTMLEETQWQFTSSGACTQPETKWNSVKKPCLDWDQCVIKSVKVASQTNLFAWYFQLSEFHNIPAQESLFQNQKWPASPLLCRQWRQSFLILNVTYLFYFWPCWVFIAAQVFLLHLVVKGGSCCSLMASHCGGFYRCRAQSPGHEGLGVAVLGSRAEAQ